MFISISGGGASSSYSPGTPDSSTEVKAITLAVTVPGHITVTGGPMLEAV